MGGMETFVKMIDSVFSMAPTFDDTYYGGTIHEIREMQIAGMGQYAHGNQPIQHMVYLYNYAGQPWKTQQRVRMILKNQYKPAPDGLGGNDDCGQMSAWYLFSTLGFYPVAPGSGTYQLGSPAINKAVIQLENGKTFTINCKNQNDKNIYVQKISLNGKPLKRLFLQHSDITNGGTLEFQLGSSPAKKEFQ